MADRKITDLTALTAPATGDLLPIVDVSESAASSKNKKITFQDLQRYYDSDASHYVAFAAPGTVSTNLTWTLPATDGTTGQVLSTNGSGTLSWSAGGGVSDGDKGDITVSSSGATWTIDNDSVTYAKIQNVSATDRLLGRSSAGAGNIEELTIGSGLSLAAGSLTATYLPPRAVAAGATTGTLTPNGDTTDLFVAEGLTGAITLAAPSGTPVNGQKLLIRLKDNGTARGITWTTSSGAYRAIGITLPTTTVINKTTYVGCVYNSAGLFWDAIATVTEA
jgi:hypothetical protein